METIVEPCNNTSVGMLVYRDSKLLLIERARPPYGWAPPAGHVDSGESYENAARRELFEEVGLIPFYLKRVYQRIHFNKCRRPNGDHHDWQVFRAYCTGDVCRSEEETNAIRWVAAEELEHLMYVTETLLLSSADPEEWKRMPGLEPVWMQMITAIRKAKDEISNSERREASMGD